MDSCKKVSICSMCDVHDPGQPGRTRPCVDSSKGSGTSSSDKTCALNGSKISPKAEILQ